MPVPFYERLASYYESLGEILRVEKRLSSVLPNPADMGWVRESKYAKILEHHLPAGCNILFGGFLFDSEGNESLQVDIIICSDEVPQFKVENKSFATIDGTIGVFEVKSTLTKQNLITSLQAFASLPEPKELEDWQSAGVRQDILDNYHYFPHKVIFAYDGLGKDEIEKILVEFYTTNSDIPNHKKPDVIHVCGKCTFNKTLLSTERKIILREVDGLDEEDIIALEEFAGYPDKNDVLGFSITFIRIQEVANIMKNILFDLRYILDEMLKFGGRSE